MPRADDIRQTNGIRAFATCFGMEVWCARCGVKRIERPWHSEETSDFVGRPRSHSLDEWRAWLARIGWTEGGTVCLACSQPKPKIDWSNPEWA